MIFRSFTILSIVLVLTPLIQAEELIPADTPIEKAIDHYINLRLKEDGIKAAPQIGDADFLSRVMLDLVGRIPTQVEMKKFLASKDADKRAKVVDQLIQSPAFVRYQAQRLDQFMMNDTGGSIRDYLQKALEENRSWDRIFREVMLPDQKDEKQKGLNEFLKRRAKDPDQLTNEVSVIFFGVNVSCAKCHDHPLVDDWKQSHFYGMKTFLSRTIDNGGFLAEREFGEVKYKTTKGKEYTAKMMFLTGKVIEDPGLNREPSKKDLQNENNKLNQFKKQKKPAPAPTHSARKKLVETALQKDQREFFARSIVNRLWNQFYGRGLVMPLDQMHSANPASHPDLLAWLARDVADHGYDLRRLIRGLVLSEAYGRSSQWHNDDPPLPQLFAVAQVRVLTPMQMGTSIQIAITDQSRFENLKPEDFEKQMAGMEARGRGIASKIEQPYENFQISVGEALLFSNDEAMQRDLLSLGGDRLLSKLKDIKDNREIVEKLYQNVYCRKPTPEEAQVLVAYLEKLTDRKAEACQQLMWALLTSAEFRFNH